MSLRHLHRHPRVIAFVQEPTGKLLVWALASAMLVLAESKMAAPASVVLALTMILPGRRDQLLTAAGLAALYFIAGQRQQHYAEEAILLVSIPLVLGLLGIVWLAARSYRKLPKPIRQRPQTVLHLLMWALLATALLPIPDTVKLAIACLPFLVWRCGYLLLSGKRGSIAAGPWYEQVFYLAPIWGGTNTPYGKGLDYLRRHGATTREEWARSQLAGLKLLVLALVWQLLLLLTDARVDHFRLPGAIAHPGVHSVWTAWIILIGELFHRVLQLAATGHVIIGLLRLFGYNVFRNTYKPLLSESILEFWNRLYFYFKELLVEFFFFPFYLRWFRGHPRLRVTAAVFAAAGVGNLYYHALVDAPALSAAGPLGALELMAPRAFHCFLLATGITVSMLRQQRRRGKPAVPPSLPVRLRRIAGVWLFFAIIRIWSVRPLDLSFAERTRFFLFLFGAES